MTEIPGFPGQTGQIWEYVVEEGFDLFFTAIGVPWVAVIVMFLQPFIQWIASFFQGRAATGIDSATDDDCLFMIASQNPIPALWGMAARIMESKGMTISSSEPAIQAKWKALNEALRADLNTQFNDNDVTFGQYGYLLSLHDVDSDSMALAARANLDRQYLALVADGKLNPATGFPFPTIPPPPPPPPPPTPPPITGPQSGCTDPCQLALLNMVNQQVVPQLASTASALRTLSSALTPASPQVQAGALERIADALTELESCTCADFNALVNDWLPAFFKILSPPAGATGPLTALVTAIEAIPAAINAKTSADTNNWDVPQAIIDQLVAEGAMSTEMGQLVTGAMYAKVRPTAATSDILSMISKLTGWLKDTLVAEKPTALEVATAAKAKLLELLQDFFTLDEATFGWAADNLLQFLNSRVAGITNVEPGAQDGPTSKLFGDAFALGLTAHLAAILGEAVYPTKNLGLPQMAALMVDMAGFRPLVAAYTGPTITHAIRKPSDYSAAAQFTSTKTDAGSALPLYGRGKISQAQLKQYLAWSGYNATESEVLTSGAYRPVSPFLLERGFVNRPYPSTLMASALEDMGMDPRFIPTINTMLEELTTEQLENQYLTELQSAYAKGAVPLTDLTEAMTNLGYSPAAQNLVLQRATLIQQSELIAFVVKEYQPELAAGLVTPAQYSEALQAAGAQPWFVDQQVALAQAKQFTRMQIKAQAVAKRDANTIWTRASSTATEQYLRGEIDLAALTAELTAAREVYLSELPTAGLAATDLAGEEALSPVIVTSMVASAQARTTLTKQFVYGLLLDRAAALVLREQVAALLAQFKETALTVDQLNTALRALNIPGANVEALVAKAAVSTQTAYSYATKIAV